MASLVISKQSRKKYNMSLAIGLTRTFKLPHVLPIFHHPSYVLTGSIWQAGRCLQICYTRYQCSLQANTTTIVGNLTAPLGEAVLRRSIWIGCVVYGYLWVTSGPLFIKQTDGRLTVPTRKVSKPRDSGLHFFNRSEIWQATRQQRFHDAY